MKNNHNLKVLHIASGDLWAGAEVQLSTLAKALMKRTDTTVEVVLLNHGKLEQELISAGISVTILDETRHNGIVILCRLVSILRRQLPDIVHTHRLKENILGALATGISGNLPCLRTVHGAPEYPPSWRQLTKRLILFIDGLCANYLQQGIIAVSGDLAIILKNLYPKQRVYTITNGIDVETLEEKSTTPAPFPPKDVKTFRIGIAGRLVPVKRIDLFIKIAYQMLDDESFHDFSFHIYGDGPLRKELESLKEQLNIDDRLKFEGHCDNIHAKIRQLDLLLLTSEHEGLPMVLLEAMALKTPIISRAVGGIPQLLGQHTTSQDINAQANCGLLVEHQQVEGYIEQIKLLLDNPELYKGICTKAYLRVKKYYSAEKNANNYYEKYTECLRKR
jgi:glycosyltransferase involved in cell wall biosynthesis